MKPLIARSCWFPAVLIAGSLAGAEPGPVVINEIMYHPPRDLEQLQYIEVYNAGKGERDLSGWSFSKGVKFVFPANTKLQPGGYLVVCRDWAALVERYGTHVPVVGQFVGHLSHGGERLELSDQDRNVVDGVKYADSTPWPMAADGHSASLERICPFAPGEDASNWSASKLPEIETPAGTPGRRNDSFASNPPPVISDVTLTPGAPLPEQPVAVEASVADARGVENVELVFQVVAPNRLSGQETLPMKRVSGDERSGRYQVRLPSQPEGRLVRYRIQAVDTTGVARTSPPQNDLRGAWTYSTFTNSNSAKIPFGLVLHPGIPANLPSQRNVPVGNQGSPTRAAKLSRGHDAFIYVPPNGGEVQTFDFVQAPARKGGYKVHFLKDQTLRGMSGINIIFEDKPRFVLAEALSYELYRLVGTPAELNEHLRLWVDGTPRGYQLLIEQPNKSFLARNHRNTNGNLYKYLWYENDIVSRHEKKTNLATGHEDLLAAISGLESKGSAVQWAYIQDHFNVDEFIDYFVVNMCIQNWDGFHNNHFLYHDTGDTGRWEIYPWDEDKTFGDYNGASPKYDWYEMPLNFGSKGSVRPAAFGGPTTGESFDGWWRQPGYVAGPMLSNPQFRERFLLRLREVCTTIFTEEKVFPLIDAMESRLEQEVPLRAQLKNEDPAHLLERFHVHIQSLRNQVTHRRKFILDELDKLKR
jgi:hypothetical protein